GAETGALSSFLASPGLALLRLLNTLPTDGPRLTLRPDLLRSILPKCARSPVLRDATADDPTVLQPSPVAAGGTPMLPPRWSLPPVLIRLQSDSVSSSSGSFTLLKSFLMHSCMILSVSM